MKTKEPKYKVGDMLQFKSPLCDNEIGTLIVDKIEQDNGRFVYVHVYSERLSTTLYEEKVIGKVDFDQEEYELYLKLKEKYGNII